MAVAESTGWRVSVHGKFIRLNGSKFHVKGVSYGPLTPNAAGQPFASPEQTASDFDRIRELGANLVRIYHVPARWFLDLAQARGIKVLVDVPWNKQFCFLDSEEHRREAKEAVRRAAGACARHPAFFGLSVVNEIPADVARWSGAPAVSEFIDELVAEAKRIDPECLCTFGNYPPTEFLRPQSLDFLCFNVYLHEEQPFKNYLARLQMMAESKPLILGEIGFDSIREGEARKSAMLERQIQWAFRGGLAGAVVFSFTDEWFKDGRLVEDWEMGLTRKDRTPKESFLAVKRAFQQAPRFRLEQAPKVSVVVASYNAERTLDACLESLERLQYPDFEVVLVDDGSTDSTPTIARRHPGIRYFRHEQNLGLSEARNTGIRASSGEIVAFTDADCRADEDWLYYLVNDLESGGWAGVGGPNLLPPEDSSVAAAVMASPGGPAHVMLTDRQAEHIPGCNMAFHREALLAVGLFDPLFRKAGDDVDICWRLQQAGYRIGFSPAAFVWHYRRSTIGAYARQQLGYGEAEALLVGKHPEYFNFFGGSIWRGRIYTASKFGVIVRPPVIYRGLFASAGYQTLYASAPALPLMLCTTLEYHVLLTLPLWVLSATFHYLLPLAITCLLVPATICAAAGWQAELPVNKKRWWSRPLVALLFFIQPVVRGWARYRGRLEPGADARAPSQNLDSIALRRTRHPLNQAQYLASDSALDRLALSREILRRLDRRGWVRRPDIGWSNFDFEVHGGRWTRLQLTSVAEDLPDGKQVLRFRLRARWTLLALAAFWSLCAAELLVIGFGAEHWRWLWALLLTMPLPAWYFARKKRDLQSIVIVFLDELAADHKLTRVMPPAFGVEPSRPTAISASTPRPAES
jgi:GT2 family glycosyltransferase